MMPTRYAQPEPAQVKKQVSQIAHLSPPLKGLNFATKSNVGDPATATNLVNFIVEDDRITMRGGFRMVAVANPVPVTNLSKTNPAVCTVAAADIAKFVDGDTVLITGVTTDKMTVANGKHVISSVGTPANTFTLAGVDTSGGAAAQTSGVLAGRVNHGGSLADSRKSEPIWHIIPWYGNVQRLLASTANTLYNAETGVKVKDSFTSGDWHWTSFSNLSQTDYTVMVNGTDGVWSWDGSLQIPVDYGKVTVTALSNTSPAQVTVGSADIGKFHEGQVVVIEGADPQHAAANGAHIISSVGTPANTFKMVGVDLTATTAVTAPTGITANPPGIGVIKEDVTIPTGESWASANLFHIVVAHMNRLFFADAANLAVFYLPIQRKSGQVKILPLNAYFKRGGYIKAMYTWSVDGGVGIEDLFCIFTSNGECLIYSGSDPDTNFQIKGIFRFDAPMSKHSIVNYGGELFVLISTGLVPMSTLMKAETEQLGTSDKSVLSMFTKIASQAGEKPGWQAILNPQSGRVYCNMPQGGVNQYSQMVRHMPRPVWSEFRDVPSRCWCWAYPYMWFADDRGNIYQGHTNFLSDDGLTIKTDLQMAWSQFSTPGVKQFKMLKVYYVSDGDVKIAVDMKVDYDTTSPQNIPDVTFRATGAAWDEATWAKNAEDAGGDYWAAGPVPNSQWNGVGRLGRVGAVRLTTSIQDCEFSITGFDLIYETGAAVG